jgi:hypothetical protein
VKLLPWQYLFLPFNARNFHDLFYPTWVGSLALLSILIILYNVRTRQLRNHPPYLELYEWLLWTGVITFGLLASGIDARTVRPARATSPARSSFPTRAA